MTVTLGNLFNGLLPTPTTQANVAAVAMSQVPLALPLKWYQQEALDHCMRDLQNHPYAYLALDMGLGKTPTALAVAAAAAAAGQTPTCAVVPPTLRINWQREAAKFAPWLKVVVLRGVPPEGAKLPEADLIIVGCASLGTPPQTTAQREAHIVPQSWGDVLKGNIAGILVDEAHYFKNKSGRSKALAEIAAFVPGIRILMSGTPTPNGRHAELAAQIKIMGNRAWRDIGGEGTFWYRYAPKIDENGGRTSENAEELFAIMSSTWYHRRLRGDVETLPNKGRTILSLEAKGKPSRDYLKAEKSLIAWLQEEGRDTRGAARAEALVRLTTLRRLAGESKVPEAAKHVVELLNEEPGGVFVVAEHVDVIDGLLVKLARFNPMVLAGGMSDREKQANIDAFTSGESRVLVGQIVTAGTGLTLHGDGRNRREVVVQLPWTPAALMQVEDRLHRIGQTKDVEIEICLAAIEGNWTIDERLWGLIERKAFSASSITDGEGAFLLSDVVESLLDTYRFKNTKLK